jgi:hypothetical protein
VSDYDRACEVTAFLVIVLAGCPTHPCAGSSGLATLASVRSRRTGRILPGAQLKHRLAIGLLQVTQLALVLLTNVLRLGSQGVLHALAGMIDPILDLGRRQVVA